jgi:predicted O-methyltransferase YrrM
LDRKADHGERALASGSPPEISWHLKRWARLRAADGLDAEWAANSYAGTSLDVYGQVRSLIVDRRLRDAVAPFLPEAERGGHDRRSHAASGIVQRRRCYLRPWPPAVTSAPAIQPASAGNAVPTPLPRLHPASDRSAHAHDDPWRPQSLRVEGANQGTITFLASTSCRVIAEVGIYEGHTSRHIAELLAGEGELHLFDFSDRVDEVVAQLNEAGYHNVVGHGNSRKLLDSYNWSLMRVLQNNTTPLYDYVFLDGAHVWALDALAFFLIDRLLKPGGYIDFDDYGWSLAISPALNPVDFPKTAELYTSEQIQERQVAIVVDLLVKRDHRYVEVVKNKIFQKVR